MRNRRYEIHRDESQTLTLVFDTETGRWSVEVWGPKLKRTSLSIDAFEKSEDGVRHYQGLKEAIGRAIRDV